MRVLFAVALIALAVTSGLVGAASAENARGKTTLAQRTAPLVIYDYQPGVVVRAYWQAPWRHRHYYPTTGDKPEIGREEDLSASSGGTPEPAEKFQRSWSTSSAFIPEQPHDGARTLDDRPAPRAEQPPQTSGAVKP